MKALVLALVGGCSFAFVHEPSTTTATEVPAPECTTSRAMPATDLAIGAVLGALAAAVTYSAVERFNDMCTGECYHAWKPATLAAFLVVSPWWISSAVGFSDTGRCRAAYRERGIQLP